MENKKQLSPEEVSELETPERRKFNPLGIWDELGITEHTGGIYATKRLIELCRIAPSQYVLDIGCGTGYTSCLLAEKYHVDVAVVDISPRVLKWTEKRIAEEGVSDKVTIREADAHKLPFPSNTFDTVIAESVLVFCDRKKVSSEAYRVLKPNGVFGDNEVTYLKHPPNQVRASLSKSLGIHPLLEDEWQAVFREAGFVDVYSSVYRANFSEMILSHLQVDGVRRYLSALRQSISDPTIKRMFFNKGMLKAMLQYSSYVGYGLYVSRKS